MRDFYPEDMAIRNHLFDSWRQASAHHGFEPYDAPVVETLDLLKRKSGEEIVHQIYAFKDKSGRDLALRPEMTPSLARILGDRSRGMSKPIRWFAMPQLFRYERQQRGRLREHFQWNVDLVGEEGVAADAEVLAVAVDGLRELGLTAGDFRARVSDRVLLSALLGVLGVSEEGLPAAFAVIDKLERLPREKAVGILSSNAGLSGAQAGRVLETVSSATLDTLSEALGSRDDSGPAVERLRDYLGALGAMGLGDYVEIDLGIVRGLAYYTGIVFELFDRQGELRAICGGGRYDRLLELVGGEPLPAVGFGMGDVVLGELLAERELVPEFASSLDYFIVTVSWEQRDEALRLAHGLREKGHSVSYALREQGVGKQMKVASKEGAREVLIVGPDELARGCVVARDMSTGGQREIQLAELI